MFGRVMIVSMCIVYIQNTHYDTYNVLMDGSHDYAQQDSDFEISHFESLI